MGSILGNAARTSVIPTAALVIITAALGIYAVALNRILYATHGPFYDSLSYSLELARVYGLVHERGLGNALFSIVDIRSTVFLPWVEACFFAPLLALRRDLFVYLQLPWLLLLGLAAYSYFLRRIRATPLLALAFCLPLMSIRAEFYFDGGLSDFRMDFFQYLLMGATFLLYLSAAQGPTRKQIAPWCCCGALAGLTCLARATTPIYLVLAFGPLLVADLLREPAEMRATIRNYGAAGSVAVLVAGWFYVANYRFLYYYYFMWNAAANEHLPLNRSIGHVGILFGQNIGWPILSFLGLCIALAGTHRLWCGLPLWRDLNWRSLWLGAAPLGFLVFWGAGLNPFVSTVAATGILVFGQTTWIANARPLPRWMEMTLVLGAALASVTTSATGIASHSSPPEWVPKAAAIDGLLGQLTSDISLSPARRYRLCFVHAGSIDSDVVRTFLIFDRRLSPGPDGSVALGKSSISARYGLDRVSTRAEWEALSGADDAAKIEFQVNSTLRDCDYVLLPTATSQLFDFFYANRYVPEIRQRLLSSGRLVPLGSAWPITPQEQTAWYRVEPAG